MKDVARHAGVSPGVVSRVLNEGTGPVAPETRRRVLASIRTLRYRPHSGARELKTRTTNTIGLVLADVSNHFFAELADHVVRAARARGLGVLLTTTQEDAALEGRSLDMLMDKRVRGVIAAPTGANAAAWRQVRAMGVQLVFVDRTVDRVPGADVVGVDNDGAAFAATAHLVAHGHRRIALISGPPWASTGRERLAGYGRALAESGADRDPRLVCEIDFRDAAGADAALDGLLALDPPATGLIVCNTALAETLAARVRARGVAVPGELSIVVFHDAPWTALMTPGLTVVRHPVEALAARAVELLSGRLGPEAPARRREVRLSSALVERESVAPPGPGRTR